jgi:hypothetical protein
MKTSSLRGLQGCYNIKITQICNYCIKDYADYEYIPRKHNQELFTEVPGMFAAYGSALTVKERERESASSAHNSVSHVFSHKALRQSDFWAENQKLV